MSVRRNHPKQIAVRLTRREIDKLDRFAPPKRRP